MHWRNSHFQIRHFLAGRCHTPDEAYRLLCELREERMRALEQAQIGRLQAAWQARLWRWLTWVPYFGTRVRLALGAQVLETPRLLQMMQVARDEVAEIEQLIREVEPHRRYAHLGDARAHQAAQREEWCEELKFRAENFLIAEGRIPADQLATMRQHPDFAVHIWPRLCEVRARLLRGDDGELTALLQPPSTAWLALTDSVRDSGSTDG